jgi:hypothetical protein
MPTPFVPFSGFTPNVDPTTPGAILACSNMIPTIRGMKAAPSPTPYGNPAFPTRVMGAATCELLTGAYRTFAGTATDLYEVVGNTNNNVSATAGGYAGGDNRWRFAQFGNASLASNGQDPIQQSISAGKFEPIGDIGSITITNGGSGYYAVPTVTITGGNGTGATATAVLTSNDSTPIGSVDSVTVTNAGVGYTSVPTAVFSAPPAGGTEATGTVVLNGAVGGIASVTITNSGANYTSPPTVAFGAPPTGGTQATGTAVMTGSVASVTLTDGGSGYATAPIVTFGAPLPGGTQATGVAQISGGVITGVSITAPGSGYPFPPSVTFTGGGGENAVGESVMTTVSVVYEVIMDNYGAGYTTAPSVTFSGGGGTGAAGTAVVSTGTVAGVIITNQGAGYLTAPTITLSGGGPTTPAVLTPVLAKGTVTGITLTDQGSAYTGQATVAITGGGGTGAAATAVMNLAPSAAIITVTQGFVFALNINSVANGSQPNGWWCSGLYDQTQWTPDQSTQCANGTMVDTPGQITAGTPFGTNLIVFKGTSMFYGVYEGPPVIWAFNLISPTIGTPCQEAVVNIGASLVFLGSDSQVYEFDGALPYPIGTSVREWLLANWSATRRTQVCSYHDQPNSTVYWYFCGSTNTTGIPDTSLVYNYLTGKFGSADLNVEAALQAITGQITWEDMGSLPNVTTWSTLPQIPYNDPYWSESSQIVGIIDSTQTLQTLNGVAGNSSLTTNYFGDDLDYSSCQGVIPRFTQQPSACYGTANTMATLGSASSTLGGGSTAWPDSEPLAAWYDGVLAADFSARWIQFTLNFTGNHEIIGMYPQLSPAGEI